MSPWTRDYAKITRKSENAKTRFLGEGRGWTRRHKQGSVSTGHSVQLKTWLRSKQSDGEDSGANQLSSSRNWWGDT